MTTEQDAKNSNAVWTEEGKTCTEQAKGDDADPEAELISHRMFMSFILGSLLPSPPPPPPPGRQCDETHFLSGLE